MTFRNLAMAGSCAVALVAPTVAAADPLPLGGTAIVGAAGSGAFTPLAVPVRPSQIGSEAVSPDGRYVAFQSSSAGLSDENDDTVRGIYVKDRTTGTLTLASRRSGVSGSSVGADCYDPSISVNAGVVRVAFTCGVSLVSADTNDRSDIYVRDLAAGTTTLVSAVAGTPGNEHSYEPSISGNGEYVAFTSLSSNLVGGVTGRHIFRRRLGSGDAVALVDVAPGGGTPNDQASEATISDDGQRVAFTSYASNIAPVDTNGTGADVFWRDMTMANAKAVSVADTATTPTANGTSERGRISGDGAYVAFSSTATTLNDGDLDTNPDVHRRSLNTDATRLISKADGIAGAKLVSTGVSSLTINTNGDVVGFVARDPAVTGSSFANQAIVRRVGAGSTELVSRKDGDAGALATDSVSGLAVAGDGSSVAFTAPAMVPEADPFSASVVARSLTGTPRTTAFVSRPAGTGDFKNLGSTSALEGTQAVSADGRYVVFSSSAQGLPGQPPTTTTQIWRRDTLTGEVVLISRADGPAGAAVADGADAPTISADGNRVTFTTSDPALGTGGDNIAFVRDVAAGTTTAVSRADGPNGALADADYELGISLDGNRVAFISDSAVVGVSDSYKHLFVRDIAAGTTTAIAPALARNTVLARLDADGSRVAWEAEKLDPFSSTSNVYVTDVAVGAPTRVDPESGATDETTTPSISADGTRVGFLPDADIAPGDTNGQTDLVVKDLTTGALQLASVKADGTPLTMRTDYGELSQDGTTVAFTTDQNDVDPATPTVDGGVYRRVLGGPGATLVSRADGAAGAPADTRATAVSISGDGACVVYETTARNLLTPTLEPFVGRIWLRAAGGTCPSPAPPVPTPTPTPVPPAPGGTPAPTPGATPGPGTTTRKAVVSRFKASPSTFRTTGKKRGTRFTFRVDLAAAIRIAIQQPVKGHRSGSRCVAGAPKRGQRACTRIVTLTTLKANAKAGRTTTVRFNGVVKRKRLRRGTYYASITARTAGGTSKARRITLRVR